MTAPTDRISVELEAQQWNIVLAAMGEAPWRLADPIIRAISHQANLQAEPKGDDHHDT